MYLVLYDKYVVAHSDVRILIDIYICALLDTSVDIAMGIIIRRSFLIISFSFSVFP